MNPRKYGPTLVAGSIVKLDRRISARIRIGYYDFTGGPVGRPVDAEYVVHYSALDEQYGAVLERSDAPPPVGAKRAAIRYFSKLTEVRRWQEE